MIKKYKETNIIDLTEYKGGNSIFRMYDVDENGMIDLNEMTRLVKSIFKVSQSKVISSFPPLRLYSYLL